MKAVLVNGTHHGKCIELAILNSSLILPKKSPATSRGNWLADVLLSLSKPESETYMIHDCFPNVRNAEVVVYSCDCCESEAIRGVYGLEKMLVIHGVVVGLALWLDSLLESELAYDAELKKNLFAARLPFELAIKEIERRQNRLQRRFH